MPVNTPASSISRIDHALRKISRQLVTRIRMVLDV
jgi:hypothetical protein